MTQLIFPGITETYPFTYVDVGARWGRRDAVLGVFRCSRWIGFEPDPEEHARLQQQLPPGDECFPYAVGARTEQRQLFITRSPDWSSLYQPDPEVFRQFRYLSMALEVVRTVEVATRALDDLASEAGGAIATADYLKIDVQGATLDVLMGAEELLRNVSFVEIEAEFVPLYRGEVLFGQIHEWLVARGFTLLDLSRNRCFHEEGPGRSPARGEVVWTDALYVRQAVVSDAVRVRPAIVTAAALSFIDTAVSLAGRAAAAGTISEREADVVDRWAQSALMEASVGVWLWRAIARLPGGRWGLRRLRRLIDRSYWRLVDEAYPEYYFHRD